MDNLVACCWMTLSRNREEVTECAAEVHLRHPRHAIVESCQRLEAYGLEACGCDADQHFSGDEALRHLAEVSAGLHSVVLGEAQILGQVRSALAEGPEQVRRAAEPALAAARALRRETSFDSHAGHLLDRALTLHDHVGRGRLLVLGPGQMGRLVAERGVELGFAEVVLAGRTVPRALPAGTSFAPLDAIRALAPFDVVAGCLGSGAAELSEDELPAAQLLLDLGTPRNFAAQTRTPKVTIADLFADESSRPHAARRRNQLKARLHELLEARLRDARQNSASPVGALRFEVERIRQREVERLRAQHPELPASTLEALTRSLVNQLFHAPSERLRQGDPAFVRQVAELFAP